MKAAIHQPQYLPYLGFFHKVAHCDVFVALDSVQFQERGVQHRNKIKTKDGWQWLTVPVIQNRGQLIQQVRLDGSQPWGTRHWKAIVSNYSRAPFFKMYEQELAQLLVCEYASLVKADMCLMEWILRQLEIDVPIVYASTMNVPGAQTELLLNLTRAVGATTYLSGPGGKRYMDLDLFARAGIEVEFQEFQSPTYEQVFPQAGFVSDLSVIDALLCCGPRVKEFVH